MRWSDVSWWAADAFMFMLALMVFIATAWVGVLLVIQGCG